MSDPDPAPYAPFWDSQILRRLALALVVELLAVFHVSNLVSTETLAPLIDTILEIVGMAYTGWAMHARAAKKVLPILTPTKTAAVAANAAVVATVVPLPKPETPS